jgi:hypothetical protein
MSGRRNIRSSSRGRRPGPASGSLMPAHATNCSGPPKNDGYGPGGMFLSTMSNIEARQPSRAAISIRTFHEHVNMILVARSRSALRILVHPPDSDRRMIHAEPPSEAGHASGDRSASSASPR